MSLLRPEPMELIFPPDRPLPAFGAFCTPAGFLIGVSCHTSTRFAQPKTKAPTMRSSVRYFRRARKSTGAHRSESKRSRKPRAPFASRCWLLEASPSENAQECVRAGALGHRRDFSISVLLEFMRGTSGNESVFHSRSGPAPAQSFRKAAQELGAAETGPAGHATMGFASCWRCAR